MKQNSKTKIKREARSARGKVQRELTNGTASTESTEKAKLLMNSLNQAVAR